MTEIKVNEDFVNEIDEIISTSEWDSVNKIELCNYIIGVYLDNNADYQSLKALNENVKQAIKAYKAMLAVNAKTRSYSLEEIEEIDDLINLLQNLYKTNQE